MLARLDRVVQRVARVCDELSAAICAILIVVTTAAVAVYQLGIALAWLDDVLRTLLIWLVYLGTVSLCLRNDHISMDVVYLQGAYLKAAKRTGTLWQGAFAIIHELSHWEVKTDDNRYNSSPVCSFTGATMPPFWPSPRPLPPGTIW